MATRPLLQQAEQEIAEAASPTAVKWLFLLDTVLAFSEAKQVEFWAGDAVVLLDSDFPATRRTRAWLWNCDAGLADLRGIVTKVKDARASEDNCLRGAAKAYVVIRDAVKDCSPDSACGKKASSSLLRMWTDVTVWHCARVSGVNDCNSFMGVLDEAFDGQISVNRTFSSRMQLAYHKAIGGADGAFSSKTARRGRIRARVRAAQNRVPAEEAEETATDDTAAAASNVDVTAGQNMIECSYEEEVCKLVEVDARTERGWQGSEGRQHELVGQAASSNSNAWYVWCQCHVGHLSYWQETEFQYARCPMCNYPMYVYQWVQ